MLDEDWEGLVRDHPRLCGSRPRALTFLAIALLLLAASSACLNASGRVNASDTWSPIAIVAFLVASGAFVLWLKEFRRPIQMGFDGRCRSPKIAAAELRWHPSFAEIASEVKVHITSHGRQNKQLVDEALFGRVTGRILLDEAPLRVGARAWIWFSVSTARGDLAIDGIAFRLRCAQESPQGLLRLQSTMRRLAELDPAVCDYDASRDAYRLAFDLPADVPGSDLLADEPVAWELSVVIDSTPSLFAGRFFVPVG